MGDNVIPGTTVEYQNPNYQGYNSPTDVLVINVAYLVDADFRRTMRNRNPLPVIADDGFLGMDSDYESSCADEAKKRLGISFGADYKFPEGFTAKTFQQAFLKGISPSNVRKQKLTEAEKKNLNHVFSLLKDLNSEAFKELKVSDLSDEEKYDMVLGMCSKFKMEDINHYMHIHRENKEHKSFPGIQFVISEETKAKLCDFLKLRGTSFAYLGDYVYPEWSRVPERDFKIRGLMEHAAEEIATEIKENSDRFFGTLRQTSNPSYYADIIIRNCFHPDKIDTLEDAAILRQLVEVKKQVAQRKTSDTQRPTEGGETSARKGLSGVLRLANRILSPVKGGKVAKEILSKGYRFFYSKPDPDR